MLIPILMIFFGIGGTTFGMASAALEMSLGEGMGLRAIMLFVMEAIGIVFVMKYAKKVKNDPSKSLVLEY